MSKVLIFTAPGHGHINPTLPVAQELIARGEEVVYYTTENFVPHVEAIGATAHIYNSIFRTLAESFLSRANSAGAQTMGMPFLMADEASHVLPQVLENARAENADYVIYDPMCLWGRIVAQMLQLPAITFRPTYAMDEGFSVMRMIANRIPRPDPEMMDRIRAKMSDLETTYGLSLPANPFSLMASMEALNIVFLPRVFQPHAELFDERFVFVGPSIAIRSDAQEAAQELDLTPTEEPLLFISLGTVFNNRVEFFQQCFQAFGQQPLRVIMGCGTRIDRASLGEVPANFQVHPYVPQLDVLRQTAAFITHGGMNSTMEALYYGIPLVVIPQMVEQAMTARRVSELQLGLAIEPEQVTVEALQAAVREVLNNPGYKERATQMQGEIQQAGGYTRAADAILAFRAQRS
ncbi:MAG TPA: macrolide family glycosyltransferase [Ktedonobacteraceae bacterium]|jgi:MGT family glycosyltransferase|nr:macrolide family glycosyltransferase [Ktedonobacteraceae bacterium]